MSIITVCAICVTSAIVAGFIKQYRPEYAVLISVGSGCAVMLVILASLAPILSETEKIFDASGIDADYIKIMLKAAGVCYISHFGGLICKDSGYATAAENIEICAKVTIALMILPLVSELMEIIKSLSFVG